MLRNLHALRGLAALGVVFYHLNIKLPNGIHTDFNAVAIFFVISGYLMRLTSDRDRRYFILKRLLRVLPTLWVVTIIVVIYEGSGLINPPFTYPSLMELGLPFLWDNLHSFLHHTWRTILRSLLLFPRTGDFTPLLGVTWTLTLEMICYLTFGICLIVFNRFGPVVAVGLLTLLSTFPDWAGYDQHDFTGIVSYESYFCLGVLLSYLKRSLDFATLRYGKFFAAASSAICLLSFVFLTTTLLARAMASYNEYANHTFLTFGSTLPVVATIFADAAGFTVIGPLMVLGDVSFSLYLIHSTVIETFRPVWAIYPALAPNTISGALVLLIVSIVAGVAIYRLVERPLTRLQHVLIRRLAKRPAVPRPEALSAHPST